MKKNVVSILDYRTLKGLSDVKRLLEKTSREGKVKPQDWKSSQNEFRSLTVFEDGSCLLDGATASSLSKRMSDWRTLWGEKR